MSSRGGLRQTTLSQASHPQYGINKTYTPYRIVVKNVNKIMYVKLFGTLKALGGGILSIIAANILSSINEIVSLEILTLSLGSGHRRHLGVHFSLFPMISGLFAFCFLRPVSLLLFSCLVLFPQKL